MKIAIVGSGISGMTAAYLLHGEHDIDVFEAGDYVGGHTHTIDVERNNQHFAVDTGFIVFNRRTYPNFCKMMDRLGVESQSTKMTFSVKDEMTGLEYSPHTLNTFFAQRRNLLSPNFYRMIYDILRLRRELNSIMHGKEEIEIGQYLKREGYSKKFHDHFVVPLGSSLWSTDPQTFKEFPLRTFIRFFKNHGFLNIINPFKWLVIKGGSERYVEKLTAAYSDKIRLNCAVKKIIRKVDGVELSLASGNTERFDHVVMATHSDQALALLSDASGAEKEILGSIPYQENLAVLHTDSSVLPTLRNIWSSWNYLIPKEDSGRACLTYDMNILQSITSFEEFCVTLNREEYIEADKKIGQYLYHHPVFTKDAIAAQKRHSEISGRNRTHFCGAYWGYGFHEDGVKSALAACTYFGKGL
ncbi:MAG: FAD-dependent oxidoreductase [Nitrospiraceae bacterium]|nr:MAG: FAD-dependent oxidoreductase [Nitrospiraceae bacterium]